VKLLYLPRQQPVLFTTVTSWPGASSRITHAYDAAKDATPDLHRNCRNGAWIPSAWNWPQLPLSGTCLASSRSRILGKIRAKASTDNYKANPGSNSSPRNKTKDTLDAGRIQLSALSRDLLISYQLFDSNGFLGPQVLQSHPEGTRMSPMRFTTQV
jgi:hypothetical protein